MGVAVTDSAAAIAAFGYEMGILKRLRRAGWWQAGVRDPESVAEHSLRVAQLAAVLAAEENGNPERAAYLALWHDSQETRTGDLPHSARPHVTKPRSGERRVGKDERYRTGLSPITKRDC